MVAAEPVGTEAVCALHGHSWLPAWLGHKPYPFGLVKAQPQCRLCYNSTACVLPEMAPAGPSTASSIVSLLQHAGPHGPRRLRSRSMFGRGYLSVAGR